MDRKRTLAIVGGGASSALLLLHLARLGKAEGFAVTVFDRAGRFPCGVAYRTDYDCHRLNVRASNMSAFQDDPADFVTWLAENENAFSAGSFAPRTVFARYLKTRLEEATLSFTVAAEDVTGAEKSGPGWLVKTASGSSSFDIVVQASGNVRLIEPNVQSAVENYAPEPWFSPIYKRLPREGRVVLLGSGLSAMDAICSLRTEKFEGEIVVLSRNGWFPRVHTSPVEYPAFIEDGLSPSAMMKRVRAEVASAAAQGVPWQGVIDALRGATNSVWQGWDARARRIFLRRALTAWNVHRHRMSPDTAAVVEEYRARGKLRVVRDTVIRVEAPCNVVCKGATIAADAIINCMGYRYDEGRTFDVAHRIGPARFGELFETTAIPEIRAQAADIAAML